MAVLPLAFLLLFHVNIASVAEWRIIAKRSTDSGELVEKNVESSDEMDSMKIGKKMFVFAYCIYERTKEAQANCLHKHLSKQWQLHEAAEQSCDDAGNGCAFMVASSSDAGTKTTHIVVAFRGTTTLLQTFREVVDSVQFGCVPFRQEQEIHSNKGYVNKYFHSAIMDEHDNGAGSAIWERVLQVIKPLILVPKWRIAFTGHSLGGALASLAALQMHEHFQQPLMGSQSKPTRIEHSSFGQPRVGCPEFAAYFDRNIPHSLRFIHGADMIPLVPPESALCTRCNPASTNVNYKHHGQAIAVTSRPCSAMSCGDSCARCQGDVCLRLFFSCLQLLHFPRFLTDHFEYFNLNIKSKVSLFGFLEVHKLTRLQNLLSLPILAKSMLQIVHKCLGSS